MKGRNAKNRGTVWPLRPIGDLLQRVVRPVKVDPNRRYSEIGIRSHCRGIFHKPPVLGRTIGSKRVYWVEPGCLVFNIIFAWEQAVSLTTEAERGMIASHRFPMYRSTNDELLPEYAYLYFFTLRGKYALGIASPGGAGRNKTLGQEEFNRLEIPVPPIRIQHSAIRVYRLWSHAISQHLALIDLKYSLRRTLVKQLLTRQRRLAQFNDRWKTVRVGDICNILVGRTPSRKTAAYWAQQGQGYPWSTIRDMNGQWLKSTAERITTVGVKHSNAKLIPRGTTLMSFKLTVGKTSRAGIDLYTNEAIAAFVPKDKSVIQEYLCLSLPYVAARTTTDQAIKGVTLNKEKLAEMLLHLPTVPEQLSITRIVGCIDKEIDLLEHKLMALRDYRSGLLQSFLEDNSKTRQK
jgi:type I restriction enzyme, S subunit